MPHWVTPPGKRHGDIHYDAHACRYLEIPWLWDVNDRPSIYQSVDELLRGVQTPDGLPPLDVVFCDGKLCSLSNRRLGTVGRVRGQHGEALKSSMATYSSRIDDLMQELSAQTAVSVPVCTTCRMLHGVSCVCHHDPNNDRLEMHYIYRYIHIQRCTESCAVSQRQRL